MNLLVKLLIYEGALRKLVLEGVLWGILNVVNGQACSVPPISSPPNCPCSGSVVADNTAMSSGTWCIDGSDPYLNNISLNSSSVTVIVCADVTIGNINFNGGTFIVAPGVTVTFNRNISINTGVSLINYGSINTTRRITLNGGGRLFNYGTLNVDRLISNGQVVFGYGSSVTANTISINSGCGICSDTASVNISTGTLDINTADAICNEDGLFCIDVSGTLTASGTISNDNNVYVCGLDASVFASYNAIYDGTANVSVCQCNNILSFEAYILADVELEDNIAHLNWVVFPDSIDVQYFEVVRVINNYESKVTKRHHHFNKDKLLRTRSYFVMTNSLWDTLSVSGVYYYKILGWLYDGSFIESNTIVFRWVQEGLMFSSGSGVYIKCESDECEGVIMSLTGQVVKRFKVGNGIYSLNEVIGYELPLGQYIFNTSGGTLKVVKLY